MHARITSLSPMASAGNTTFVGSSTSGLLVGAERLKEPCCGWRHAGGALPAIAKMVAPEAPPPSSHSADQKTVSVLRSVIAELWI